MSKENIYVGQKLRLIDSDGYYMITEINEDKISLEHVDLCAEMNIYLEDLSDIFVMEQE